MEVIFSFSKSNIILLYNIDSYGNDFEVYESIWPSRRIFYLILFGDDSLNNYTNYITSLKLLQPEIYPARYM